MTLEPENRWLRFGLSTNPYFPEALSADDRGPRPITLFQGRRAQVKEIVDTIASEESSLILVEGPSGTGKSTLVHYAKHVLRGGKPEPRYFAPSVEVGVQSDATAQSVLVQAIDAIVRHASDLAPKSEWPKDFPAIHRARMVIETVQNLGGGWTIGGSLPGGPGASLGRTKSVGASAPQIGPVLSPAFFAELAKELRVLTSTPMDGVVLHINNLDVLMAADPRAAVRLFGDLRDHFHVAGMHWIFLGPPGFYDEAVAPEKRVKDFLKARIELEPLPVKDVHALLKARYEHYSLGDAYVKPTEEELVDFMYDRFGGDMRGTLNALTMAHRHYNPIDVHAMPKDQATQVLAQEYRKQLERDLRGKTMEILQFLLKAKKAVFSQDDVAAIEKHQPNRSARFGELVLHDAIRLTGTAGVRKLYSFSGQVRLAFGA